MLHSVVRLYPSYLCIEASGRSHSMQLLALSLSMAVCWYQEVLRTGREAVCWGDGISFFMAH